MHLFFQIYASVPRRCGVNFLVFWHRTAPLATLDGHSFFLAKFLLSMWFFWTFFALSEKKTTSFLLRGAGPRECSNTKSVVERVDSRSLNWIREINHFSCAYLMNIEPPSRPRLKQLGGLNRYSATSLAGNSAFCCTGHSASIRNSGCFRAIWKWDLQCD